MKKLVVLVLLVGCAALSACKPGDELSGTWVAESVITPDGRTVSLLEYALDLGETAAPVVEYTFSGGEVTLTMNDTVLSGSYFLSGGDVIIDFGDGAGEPSLVYSAESDSLCSAGTGITTVFKRK